MPVFLVVLIDLLGMSIILPLTPFYADKLGATDLTIGALLAAYPLAQFLAAPQLGRLSDRWGRRPILLLSVTGTMVGFGVWAAAEPLARACQSWLPFETAALAFIFLGRLIDGVSGGNITVCQACITDLTDASSRSRGLGLIGAAHGLGFIVGPPLGGYMSRHGDFAAPAWLAAGLALANLLWIAVALPESLPKEARAARQPSESWFPVQSYHKFFARPAVAPLLVQSLLFGLVFSMFQTTHSLYNLRRFGLDAEQNGLILGYVGVIMVLIQGVAMGRLVSRFSEERLLKFGLALCTLTFLGWALTRNVGTLLVVLFALALSGGVLNVVFRSLLTQQVKATEIGELFGAKAAFGSLLGAAAPLLGAGLLEQGGTSAPGYVGAAILSLLLVWSMRERGRTDADAVP
jgi:DHA1 family tetracycline resistance protein-like MFS transporter